MATESEASDAEKRSKEQLRRDLIEAAGERLRAKGASDFSIAGVAEDCETSTQMIYTFFGGKPGLLKAVYQRKTEELQERFEALDAEGALDLFYQSGQVYRDFLLEHAALYEALFSLEALENYTGPGKLIERVQAHDYFGSLLEELVDQGILNEDVDLDNLTDVLWGAVNGHVQLAILNYFPDEETARARYDQLILSIVNGHTDKIDFDPEDFGD